MDEKWHDEPWAKDMWWSGKTTRRRFLGLSASAAGALGATILVPAPWREAFGQAKPYKVGVLQPLTGVAAAGGKTALVGTQLATNRINKAGGINGRPVELVVADYESKPDVGRRKAEKLLTEDKVDVGEGGYLSNVCLACMPVFDEARTVYMIGVCLDTTITTSKCSRYVFRPFDYAPAQAVAISPYLVGKMGKKWHIVYLDYAWGQSTADAYIEQIKKAGGQVADSAGNPLKPGERGTGIPLGTADMTAFISKITGSFDGVFAIMFGANAVTFTKQAYDLGLFKKVKYAGDGAVAESTHLTALGEKIEGFVGVNRYIPVLTKPLDTPYHKRFFEESRVLLKEMDPAGPDPDRYVQSNFEAMNFLKLGIQKSGFRGRAEAPRSGTDAWWRDETMKLIGALEGMEVKESDDFPQGDKTLRREDHQAFVREFIFDIKNGKHRLIDVVAKEKTIVPPACTFPKA
jgi:branched-chain amino acid transport system substrate-binding protein